MKNYLATSKINKPILTSLILLGLLMASMLFASLPAQAQETHGGIGQSGGNPTSHTWSTTIPAGETATYRVSSLPFLSFTPNPIGVGQELLVNMWLTFPSAENRYCADYKVTITKPDGSTDVWTGDSYVADGTAWFTYVPDMMGEYKLKFEYPGQWFPAGYYHDGDWSNTTSSGATLYPAIYYEPVSTQEQTLTVQADMVMSWNRPLPTDYWTRPISPNNREWNVIAGNYPWAYSRFGGQLSVDENWYGPFITGPKSAHIVWKRQDAMAGIIGGETGNYAILANAGTPSVILMGRAYQTMTVPINGVPTSCAVSYDIRTGQQYYAIPISQGGITPTHINYWKGADNAVPGAGEATSYTPELVTVSGGKLYKIHPNTGAITVNRTLPTFTQAELMFRGGFYLSYQNLGNSSNPNYRVVNWTSEGSSSDFTSRIVSNISCTIPPSYRGPIGGVTGSYGALGAFDPESGITVVQSRFLYGNVYGFNLVAINLVNGQVLWNYSSPSSEMSSAYRPTNGWMRNGRYMAQMERGYFQAWDIRTGESLWKCDIVDAPWGEFWMYDEAAYNNLIFATGYTGVWAVNEDTGKVAWHYADPAVPFETPYTSNGTATNPIQNIRVIDGMLYVTNTEHTPSTPATRGWGMICLNATSGEFQWKIAGANLSPGAAADGYLTASSSYSGYMYVIGKGLSSTSISAPLTAVTQGQSLVITGQVLDQSPAQAGTACVSKESMAAWMDYLHHQSPIPANTVGVPVSIDAVDPNGNFVHIADVTSDMSGTYSYVFKPDMAGKYTITATFMGDDSYGSSYAETAVAVTEAAQSSPTATQTPIAMPPFEAYIAGSTIAIIVAVAIVGLMLKKRA